VAAQIRQDLPLRMETLESRCKELPLLLEKISEPETLAWSE